MGLCSLNRQAFNRTSKVIQTLLKFWCPNVTAAQCTYIIMRSKVWWMCKQWLQWSLPMIYQFVRLRIPYLATCLQYVATLITAVHSVHLWYANLYQSELHGIITWDKSRNHLLDYPALSCNEVSAWASTVVARECCLGPRNVQQKGVPTGPTKGSQ